MLHNIFYILSHLNLNNILKVLHLGDLHDVGRKMLSYYLYINNLALKYFVGIYHNIYGLVSDYGIFYERIKIWIISLESRW